MTTACPAATGRALLTAREVGTQKQSGSIVAPGSWRYPGQPRSRSMLVLAAVISIAVHVGILAGFRRGRAVPRPVTKEAFAIRLAIPDVKDLEEPEPEPVPNEDLGAKPDLSVLVPSQPDLP